jgi:Domain of unknown function (DUF4148)
MRQRAANPAEQQSKRLKPLPTYLSKERIMKIRQALTLTALVIAASSALAGPLPDVNAPLTRAEVRQSVIAARNAGELLPAGDAADYPRPQATAHSTLTRSEVRNEVLEARASGQLIPAGEGDDESFARSAPLTFSGRTRADVKSATIKARNAGELTPAGAFDDASLARDRAQARYAFAARLAHKSATTVAAGN